MSKIILKSEDIESLKNLLEMCPDTFSNIPVKFIKQNGESYISIEAIDINGDTVFSGKTVINDLEIDDNSGLVVRLPLNKALINNVLNSNFEELAITKNKISAKSSNKKLTISLFLIDDNDIFEFPYTNQELYELAKTENDIEDSKYIFFEPEQEQIKEFINTVSALSELETLEFKEKNNKLFVTGADILGNEFQYEFNVNVDNNIVSKYDINLIKILNKVLKNKDDKKMSMLVSDLLIGLTLEDDNSIITLAVTAKRD